MGCIILLITLAYSTRLIDASNTVRYTIMVAALSAIALGLAIKKIRTIVPVTIGTVALALFVLLQGISMIWAPNFAESFHDASQWLMILIAITLFYNLFKHNPIRTVFMMSWVSAIAFVISLFVALHQASSADSLSWDNRYGIVSLFTHKGTFSIMLLLMMPFPIMRLRLRINRRKWLYRIILIAILSVVVFLQARTVIVAGVFVMLTLGVLYFFKIKALKSKYIALSKILISLILCVVIVGGFRWFSMNRSIEPNHSSGISSNTSLVERQMLWRTTFRMIDRSPILGCGAGNWKICYPRESVSEIFSIDVLDYVFGRPHNDYLRIISETGYGALILMMLAIASLFVDVVVTRLRKFRILSNVSLLFLIGILVFSAFDFPFDRVEVVLWISMLAACAIASCRHNKQKQINFRVWYGVALLMLVATISGLSRWHSESLYIDVANDIHHSRWSKVEAESREARNIFCNISPMGLPYKYYEGMACEYQKKQSIVCFRCAVHDFPNCKQALCDLGRLEYIVNHNVSEAEKCLRKSISISPSYAYPYFNLAEILIKEQRYDEALATLESLDLEQKQQKINEMVWLYVKEKDTNYYINEIVPAEESAKQQMLSRIYAMKEQQSKNN